MLKSHKISFISVALAISSSACTLSPSHSVGVILPDFSLERSPPASLESMLGLSPVSRSINVGSNALPTALSDFSCFAVMVTATDIPPDPSLATCDYKPGSASMPARPGILAGMVPVTGGEIDLAVPAGTSRLFQLFAIESAMTPTCPSIKDAIAYSNSHQGQGSSQLGDPVEVGRATADILSDTSVTIAASYNAASPQVAFTCDSASSNGAPDYVHAGLTVDLEALEPDPVGGSMTPSTWTDLGPNHYSGNLGAGYAWNTTPISLSCGVSTGGCGNFNNVSAFDNSAGIPFSMDAWANPSSIGTTNPVISKEGTGMGYSLYINGTGIPTMHAGSCTMAGLSPVSPGTWHHLAGVWDGSYLHLYVDGAEQGNGVVCSNPNAATGNAMGIGYDSYMGYNFQGKIAAAHLYMTTLLSPMDVMQNCLAMEALYGPPGTCLTPGAYSPVVLNVDGTNGTGNYYSSSCYMGASITNASPTPATVGDATLTGTDFSGMSTQDASYDHNECYAAGSNDTELVTYQFAVPNIANLGSAHMMQVSWFGQLGSYSGGCVGGTPNTLTNDGHSPGFEVWNSTSGQWESLYTMSSVGPSGYVGTAMNAPSTYPDGNGNVYVRVVGGAAVSAYCSSVQTDFVNLMIE